MFVNCCCCYHHFYALDSLRGADAFFGSCLSPANKKKRIAYPHVNPRRVSSTKIKAELWLVKKHWRHGNSFAYTLDGDCNLRSGPILAFSYILFTKRNENRAWSQVTAIVTTGPQQLGEPVALPVALFFCLFPGSRVTPWGGKMADCSEVQKHLMY